MPEKRREAKQSYVYYHHSLKLISWYTINIITCVFKVFIWNNSCSINIMVLFVLFFLCGKKKYILIEDHDVKNQNASRCMAKIITSNSMLRISSDLMICTW